MRLTVVAATGGIGRQLLLQAVTRGHDVTVVVRAPQNLVVAPVRVLTADLRAPDPAVLRAAVEGADAVLSGLGARTAAEAGIASRGTRALITAMQSVGARRVIVVSAASVGTVASPGWPDPPRYNPGDGFMMRHMIAPIAKAAFRRHYADLAVMEDLLRESSLDWTVLRPPRLLDTRATGRYRTAYEQNVRAGLFISRADVAHHMLAMLDDPATVRRTVGIAY